MASSKLQSFLTSSMYPDLIWLSNFVYASWVSSVTFNELAENTNKVNGTKPAITMKMIIRFL